MSDNTTLRAGTPKRATGYEPLDVQALLLSADPRMTAVRYVLVSIDPKRFPGWLGGLLGRKRIAHQPEAGQREIAEAWNVNIALTHAGLRTLGCTYRPKPGATRRDRDGAVTDGFRDGMATRQATGWSPEPPASVVPVAWDQGPPPEQEVHALVWITADRAEAVDDACRDIFGCTMADGLTCSTFGGGTVLDVIDAGKLDGFSHFGFLDGISQPYIGELYTETEHASADDAGGGLYAGDDRWKPVRIGEFLLGHPHEGVTATAEPDRWVYDGPVIEAPDGRQLHVNGSFVVFRRLAENVAELARWLDRNVVPFRRHLQRQPRHRNGAPQDVEVAAELAANLIGRYPHVVPMIYGDTIRWEEVGAPGHTPKRAVGAGHSPKRAVPAAPLTSTLDSSPTPAGATDRPAAPNHFRYDDDDNVGRQCPLGAHIRRANPRDAIGGANLTARHRLIRQSYAYGTRQDRLDDTTPRGLAFVGVCADVEAQFEFVKREWFNAGHTLHTGSDVDPVAGDFDGADQKLVIQDTASPYITKLGSEPFVKAVYGEYFFAPSISTLRVLAAGSQNQVGSLLQGA